MESKRSAHVELWSQRVSEQEASGKNASQWCQEHALCYKSFITWRKRLKNPVSADSQKQPARFIELTDKSSTKSDLEIRLHGFIIALSKDFDRTTLIQVLDLFETIRC